MKRGWSTRTGEQQGVSGSEGESDTGGVGHPAGPVLLAAQYSGPAAQYSRPSKPGGRGGGGFNCEGDCRELQGIFQKFRSPGIGHRAVGGPIPRWIFGYSSRYPATLEYPPQGMAAGAVLAVEVNGLTGFPYGRVLVSFRGPRIGPVY